ncbi:hypothetical protein [Planobispora longispora]|uniref:Uncharacterized protein n=1 Tax=Planobispora longispora TaxID=28887 RepID=A0A8J3RNR5_9ACTN|nr:hypothetical protein [Planobispora longispora]BFE83849.1 hypothetical protein GCM10020093_064500 [Planobispora longispora]GIH78375.1 hypothetical protein Plo01_48040 [Planobispora longispora]
MSRRVLPYRRPSEDVVQADSWFLVTEDGDLALPESLSDWDYQMDLELRRRVRVDLGRARSETGLPPETALTLAAVWTATGSNLRGPADRIRMEGTGPAEVEIRAQLRGSDLGGVLVLDTALVLSDALPDGKPSAPRRAGSVLWSDHRSLRLQGDAPQFPMAVIDFAKTSFPENAAWHLQIGGNLHGATMGSLLLLVNEQNTVTATAFQNAAKPRPVDRVVLSAVYADAARVMVEHALRHDDFRDGAAFLEDTLGSTLLSLFHQLFPGSSINDVRLRFNHSPSLFASELQAAVKIFGEV